MTCNENISYDGFDNDGPQSYIYNLFVIIKNDNNQYSYCYFTMEQWFRESDNLKYELQSQFNSSGLYEVNNMKDFINIKEKYSI